MRRRGRRGGGVWCGWEADAGAMLVGVASRSATLPITLALRTCKIRASDSQQPARPSLLLATTPPARLLFHDVGREEVGTPLAALP